ncbi:hypothetical protein GGX14DRAFT_643293 [Mycena pura]|uniref:C3H1-type domain-containing protein n=1 Tax=Mycena pura TaxID=153505 RepID=A0AAD6YCV4_9AGAR|nr:hypothetical protein GGX14DRAFT_643293 [Mycena pura]
MSSNTTPKKRPSGAQRKKLARQRQQEQSATFFSRQSSAPSLAERTRARKAVSDRKLAAAEQHYEKGVGFFGEEKYEDAVVALQDACTTFKTLPKYANKMVDAYMKLEMFDETVNLTSFLVALEPKDSFEARLIRATAFMKTEEYDSAAGDLQRCKKDKPDDVRVDAAIEELRKVWDVPFDKWDMAAAAWPDFSPCTANFHLDCPSDTEDSKHHSSLRPCRYYNQGKCAYGAKCRNSHAADARSIRDNLGRNVCLFYLMDRCKFASTPGECWYSHSKAHLPAAGWWNNPSYTESYRRLYDVYKSTGSNQVMDCLLGGDMNGGWRPYEQPARFELGMELMLGEDSLDGIGSGSEDDDDPYEFGFSRGDIEELLCQGVKPWDDDAGAVLAALSGDWY